MNGIEYVNGVLLVGFRRGPAAYIYKVPKNEPTRITRVDITNGGLISLDGMVFDEAKDLLYVVSRQSGGAGFVVALRSRDGWRTAQVMGTTEVTSDCRTPTTAAFVKTGDNRGLWVVCVNGFGAGPYQISKVDVPLAKEARENIPTIWFPSLFPDPADRE